MHDTIDMMIAETHSTAPDCRITADVIAGEHREGIHDRHDGPGWGNTNNDERNEGSKRERGRKVVSKDVERGSTLR